MTAIAVTIAGSDSGGGAGIQADLKTFSALNVYGASILTAITAQNTRGVSAIHDVPPHIIAAQIDAANAAPVIAAGADGVAVISALSMKADPQAAARELRHVVEAALATRAAR